MEIIYKNEKITLQKKDRKVGSEAPAIRVKMINGETKVIGMMAAKVQVFISLPYKDGFDENLKNIIDKHNEKSLIYIISSDPELEYTDPSSASVEFKDFALKMGLYIDEDICAKSIFIINKDGEIVYKEIPNDILEGFDMELFDSKLDEAIKFKKKGHTHENWMGV